MQAVVAAVCSVQYAASNRGRLESFADADPCHVEKVRRSCCYGAKLRFSSRRAFPSRCKGRVGVKCRSGPYSAYLSRFGRTANHKAQCHMISARTARFACPTNREAQDVRCMRLKHARQIIIVMRCALVCVMGGYCSCSSSALPWYDRSD
jgi:hypothetical protein